MITISNFEHSNESENKTLFPTHWFDDHPKIYTQIKKPMKSKTESLYNLYSTLRKASVNLKYYEKLRKQSLFLIKTNI